MEAEIKFGCGPVVQQFMASDAKFRMLMGPFGSGKSSACGVELVHRGFRQKPDPAGWRKTRFAVVRNCYDDQTEILTEKRGWQLFKDLCEEDKVGTLKDGELQFEIPSYYYAKEYKGDMVQIESQNLNLCVTPDHKLYVSRINGRTKKRAPFELIKAEEVYGKTNYEFKTNAPYKGGQTEYSEDFFEFLGFWFADGSAGIYDQEVTLPSGTITNRKIYRCVLTQKDGEEYIRCLLGRIGLHYSINKRDHGDNYTISTVARNKPLIEMLAACGKQPVRRIPNWIMQAPSGHLERFLEGFIEGDGHRKSCKKDSTVMFTSSPFLADQLQEICCKVGKTSTINNVRYRVYGKEEMRDAFTITVLTEKRSNPIPKKNHWSKVPYNSMVYCVEVSSHVVLVRRKGRITFCSQTYVELEDTTMKTFWEWFPHKEMNGAWGKWNERKRTQTILFPEAKVHIEIMFRALDRPEDVKKLLSAEYTGAWINEANQIDKAIFEGISGRINRYPSKRNSEGATWAGIVMDYNPPDEDHWLAIMAEGIGNPEVTNENGTLKFPSDKFAFFQQPSGLSPLAENTKNLDENYYSDLCLGKDKDWINVFVHGRYGAIKSGKGVYEGSFDEEQHMAKEEIKPIKGLPIILGFDFGIAACTMAQYTLRGELNILYEFVADGSMDIERFLMEQVNPFVESNLKGFELIGVGDPTGTYGAQQTSRTCIEICNENGIPTEPAYTNEPAARVNSVTRFLTRLVDGKAALQVSPKCKIIKKGFKGGYHYPLKQTSSASLKPVKNKYSHPHDTVQYICLFCSGEIERVKRKARQGRRFQRRRTVAAIGGY